MNHPYNGFLNIYKEAGWTSMDVCAKLRRILGMKKIGHAGTLDPMAEGVLPVALGRATKEVDLVGESGKEYEAVMLLGRVTDTQDVTGNTIRETTGNAWPGEEEIRTVMASFTGDYEQLTPMYSARKVNGRKLYDYARAGIEVERKTKKIRIEEIEILEMDLPRVRFRVQCSKGTYIRTLCHDIGERLGCGACMEALLRTRVGHYRAENALKLSEIAEARENGTLDSLLYVEAPTAISLGKFDGTHIGHQTLLKELKKTAEAGRLRTLVLILKFGSAGVLTAAEHRQKIYDLGIDYVLELPFTEEMKTMSARDFLEKLLIGRYNMKAIVAGTDVSFGYQKQGNAAYLTEHAEEYGYQVRLIDKVRIDLKNTDAGQQMAAEDKAEGLGEESRGSALAEGNPKGNPKGTAEEMSEGEQEISSTLLRKELKKGDMLHVTSLLGAPYSISGRVIHGRHLGTDALHLPTINIRVPEELLLPPEGVYAVSVRFADSRGSFAQSPVFKGIANLGKRPTVQDPENAGDILLEAHIFGEPGDCYDQTARVELQFYIRPEEEFRDLTELRKHVEEKDIPAARHFFEQFS